MLIHLMQTKIYQSVSIKLNMRMVDDTSLIINNKNDNSINIKSIFNKSYPEFLKFKSESIKNNTIKFLDVMFIKLNTEIPSII